MDYRMLGARIRPCCFAAARLCHSVRLRRA